MSQSEANKGSNSGNVRIIPIFVEGRDQPVINSNIDIPISTSSSTASASSFTSDQHDHPQWTETHHNNAPPQWEPSPSRSFGSDLPKHGSIFERAKEFPVRDFFRRSESPARQIPVFHSTATHQPHFQNMRNSASPAPGQGQQQQQQQPPPQPSQQQQDYQKQQQQYQQQQQRKFQEHKQQQQENNPAQNHQQQQPAAPKPTPPNPRELMIQKIIDINTDVAKLMDRVEKFEGKNRKDKEYLYLDEMLTQHLIRLDDLDANGDDIIKQSRRAAIQAINHTIKALEAKVEMALKEAENSNQSGQESVESAVQQRASNASLYDNVKSDSNSSVNREKKESDSQSSSQNSNQQSGGNK